MTPPIRIGFALTGSFCTFSAVLPVVETLVSRGCEGHPHFIRTCRNTGHPFWCSRYVA